MGLAFLGRWLALSKQPAFNSSAGPHPAEPEDAESQFDLGRRFGTGESADQARAAQWYLKAAAQGHCVAQFNLGLMYGQGKGVVRNEVTAVMWLQKAAQSGHAGAQYHLGVKLYRLSQDTRQPKTSENRIEAFKWLQLAVAQAYRGAGSAREFVALGMTRQEVDEGSHRAEAFAAGQPAS